MAYEQKANTASLFKNDRKTTESHPNATGSALIECPMCLKHSEMWVSAWTKKDKSGNPWQSLAFKVKEQSAPVDKPAPKNFNEAVDENIPFANPYAGRMWQFV